MTAAAVNPPSLHELVLLALPEFPKGRTFYRSMLRAKVQKADLLKRSFADKDEWRSLLQKLQEEGILSYTSEKDEIVVPLATE